MILETFWGGFGKCNIVADGPGSVRFCTFVRCVRWLHLCIPVSISCIFVNHIDFLL